MVRRRVVLLFVLLITSTLLACSILGSATSNPGSVSGNQVTGAEQNANAANVVIPPLGWEKFEGQGAGIWLPESFDGGDLSQDLDVIVARLRSFGPDFEQMAQTIEQNPSIYAIWVFDSNIGDSGVITNVNVVSEMVLSVISLDMYLDAVLQQLPPEFQVVERDLPTIGNNQAGRLVIEAVISGVQIKELLYTMKFENKIWAVTFATGDSEFDDRLPVFEQSIATFEVLP
jgi:hypothetical protein